uniref:NB-ARC domain-containing protein n=1 Tax=Leersia perrieri TaxID=77586 RepID=A0A0D9XUZ3_9ORYZ
MATSRIVLAALSKILLFRSFHKHHATTRKGSCLAAEGSTVVAESLRGSATKPAELPNTEGEDGPRFLRTDHRAYKPGVSRRKRSMGELVSAQGAVNSLLSHAYDALAKEVKLVRGVRGDVQFIKDEMDSMNAFLLKIAECSNRNGNGAGDGDMVVAQPSPLATRIHELKARAQEVGERQQRYGVIALPPPPMSNKHGDSAEIVAGSNGKHEDNDIEERRVFVEDYSDLFKEAVDEIMTWMKEDQAPPPQQQQQQQQWGSWEGGQYLMQKPKVIPILGPRGAGKTTLAREVYDMYCSSSRHHSSRHQNYRAFWISLSEHHSQRQALEAILKTISPNNSIGGISSNISVDTILQRIRRCLNDNRFLVVLDDVPSELLWSKISDAFCCYVLVVTTEPQVAKSCATNSHRIFGFGHFNKRHQQTLVRFFFERAVSLIGNTKEGDGDQLREVLISILTKCSPSLFTMEMFLRSLYVNPHRKIEELTDLCNTLDHSSSSSASSISTDADKMLAFCCRSLPVHYTNCLAYLACFPKDRTVRRTSLVRQWLAEGLISRRDVIDAASEGALDVANRRFDALCAHKFLLLPVAAAADDDEGTITVNDGTSGGGRFKSCTVHGIVLDFISSISAHEDIVQEKLFPNRAGRIEVQNYLLQACGREAPLDDIVSYLESLAKSSRLELLNVLDLEGCSRFGEDERYLKIICNKAIHLKYLSLRNNMNVSKLPKQIQNLQQLETLDIRGTQVKELEVVLPMLKHLHSGHSSPPSTWSVRIPRHIRRMTNIEVLSHVDVSNRADEVMCLGQLLKLRKLGIVLTAKEASLMKYVFSQIDRHKSSLRSLSITIDSSDGGVSSSYNLADSYMLSPPRFLQTLSINGSRGRLPHWVAGLQQHAKITLCETYLTGDAVQVLGKLHGLQYLRFMTGALTERTIKFIGGEFSILLYLLLQQSYIISVIFDHGTAPKLERVVFDVVTMISLHGIQHLPSLKEVRITGELSVDAPTLEAIAKHPNHPRLEYKPTHRDLFTRSSSLCFCF